MASHSIHMHTQTHSSHKASSLRYLASVVVLFLPRPTNVNAQSLGLPFHHIGIKDVVEFLRVILHVFLFVSQSLWTVALERVLDFFDERDLLVMDRGLLLANSLHQKFGTHFSHYDGVLWSSCDDCPKNPEQDCEHIFGKSHPVHEVV